MGTSPRQGAGIGAAPQMGTTTLPGAAPGQTTQKQFYTNMADVPATGGWMRPPAPPGQAQGAGLNWVVPPPPQRNNLAGLMMPRDTNPGAPFSPFGASSNSGGGYQSMRAGPLIRGGH